MAALTFKGFVFDSPISEGTLRAQDLIPRFMDILEGLMDTPEMDKFWKGNEIVLETLNPEGSGWISQSDPYWDDEAVSFFLNDVLFDALNEQVPDGWYFGTHEGDGACFGFWRTEEETEDKDDPTMVAGAFASRDLWAELRNKCSMAEVTEMLRQDIVASDLPEDLIFKTSHVLESIRDLLRTNIKAGL